MIEIEHILSAYLRPTFLAINKNSNNEIEVIISCIGFKFMSVQERIQHVFSVLKEKVPKVLEENLVIIQTYDSAELDIILDNIFSKELEK